MVKYTGCSDLYKTHMLEKALTAMDEDEYNETRLWNDLGKPINLNKAVVRIIKGYYEGKEITIS